MASSCRCDRKDEIAGGRADSSEAEQSRILLSPVPDDGNSKLSRIGVMCRIMMLSIWSSNSENDVDTRRQGNIEQSSSVDESSLKETAPRPHPQSYVDNGDDGM
jgi:hypothetical protein